MSSEGTSPGPIADHTFERGFRIAALLGVLGCGLLYWFGPLSLFNVTHTSLTVLLFPVYLLFVAVLLGVWLGYETNEADLEKVEEPVDMETGKPLDWPW